MYDVNKNMKQIDRYLRGIVPPECESDPHRQQLRRQILAEVNEKQMHAPRQMSWRLAGAFSAAACILGMATGATGLAFAWRYPARSASENPPQVAVQDTNRAT